MTEQPQVPATPKPTTQADVQAFQRKTNDQIQQALSQMKSAQGRGELLHLTHAAIQGLCSAQKVSVGEVSAPVTSLNAEEIGKQAVAIARAALAELNQ